MNEIENADVVTASELVDVTVQVLKAASLERSVIAAPEHGPERLGGGDGRLALFVFGPPVVERLVIRQSSRTSPNVILVTDSAALAVPCFVARSLMSTTAVFPTGPLPVSASSFRLASLIFLRLPAK